MEAASGAIMKSLKCSNFFLMSITLLLLQQQPLIDAFISHSYSSSFPDIHMNFPVDLTNKMNPRQSFIHKMAGGVTTNAEEEAIASRDPQVFATGYSDDQDLTTAIMEATASALARLPSPSDNNMVVDLGIVHVSSLYDSTINTSTNLIVSTILSTIQQQFGSDSGSIKALIGCSAAGIVSSIPNDNAPNGDAENVDNVNITSAIRTIENEGSYGVSITLALLPDVNVKTFHYQDNDKTSNNNNNESFHECLKSSNEDNDDVPNVLLLPSPAFQADINDFLSELKQCLPQCTVFGGLASTVSSLSRARLFRYEARDNDNELVETLSDGCLGIVMSGDIEMRTMVCQGAKPVGATYRICRGEGSTISTIVLDEECDEISSFDSNYLNKARIPKPVLAEANLLLKTLSDDDQEFMRNALLIGIETPSSVFSNNDDNLNTPLGRLAQGKGHSYAVYQVASAGLKDGSVIMPLDSLKIESKNNNGDEEDLVNRIRFHVREDSQYSMNEIDAILEGYSMNCIAEAFVSDGAQTFYPSGCFMYTSCDRGKRLFGNKDDKKESSRISMAVPSLQSMSGMFCNGVVGTLNGVFAIDAKSNDNNSKVKVHGSASGYAFFGSKSKRPAYDPSAEISKDKQKDEPASSRINVTEEQAPRKSNGELIVRRREIQSGRLMNVSTVQWSVAEKIAVPTSMFEGYMWDKETEVDRFRERVPLASLLSQVKIAMMSETAASPRDWVGALSKSVEAENDKEEGSSLAIVGEVKRTEPSTGSLRQRYSASIISNSFVQGGATVLSVNCDKCFFGGSIEDVTQVRAACPDSVPILASDLILYPYQLYKLYLAGADAVTLLVAALEDKDLLYLAKIAKTLKLQTVLSVTSEVQLESVTRLPSNVVDCIAVSNRNLEDFTFDSTGEQALSILKSPAMKHFRETHGSDIPVLVEGRVGIIGSEDESDSYGKSYRNKLKEAGAAGVIIGSALAKINEEDGVAAMQTLLEG